MSNGPDPKEVERVYQEVMATGLTPLEYIVAVFRGDMEALQLTDRYKLLLSAEKKRVAAYAARDKVKLTEAEIDAEADFRTFNKLFPPMHRLICAKEAAPYVHPKIASTLIVKTETTLAMKLENANRRVMKTIEGRVEPVVADESGD